LKLLRHAEQAPCGGTRRPLPPPPCRSNAVFVTDLQVRSLIKVSRVSGLCSSNHTFRLPIRERKVLRPHGTPRLERRNKQQGTGCPLVIFALINRCLAADPIFLLLNDFLVFLNFAVIFFLALLKAGGLLRFLVLQAFMFFSQPRFGAGLPFFFLRVNPAPLREIVQLR